MSHARLDQLISTAIAEGILPAGSASLPADSRPWPVVILTALGAWLAAVPLISIFFIVFGGMLHRGAGAFIVGIPLLIATVALLRKRGLPLFVEQLLVPAFLTAVVILAWGLFDKLPHRAAAALLCGLAFAVAAAVNRNWLRALLGLMACTLAIVALIPKQGDAGFHYWGALHVALLVWLALQLRARTPILNAMASGWGAALLAGLAVYAGMTFLVGAHLGGGGWRTLAQPWDAIARTGSVLMAAGATGWIGWRWPTLRQPWSAMTAPVLLGLAWLMPSLGGVLLILAVSASLRSWRMATAAGIAAAWIIGAFYYQAAYPLQTKAIWMIAAGALLGGIARVALRGNHVGAGTPGHAPSYRYQTAGICLCALAVLAVANLGIWQKEKLIAEGRPLFVELAPVDPRSLMQGDYMQLRFRMVPEVTNQMPEPFGQRPRMVVKVDPRGIATPQRLDQGTPLATDELAVELTWFRWGWSLASDGWYFREGDAARWARARYGEFRVDSAGHVLLVGMRGPDLEPL
jgi:uncharacterized membrane-anchored protein